MKPQLRFKGYTNEWSEKKLDDITFKASSGGTPKSSVKEYYGGNINFLTISDMTTQGKYITNTEKTITEKGLQNSSTWIVPLNSLIYSIYASIGFVSINKIPLTTSQAMYNMIINKDTNTEYIYYYLQYYKNHGLHKLIETGTQGNLNAKLVKNIKIPYPTHEEQDKIASFLSLIDEKISLKKE
ncbi:MAG: restriction endonuclease subunit S, partial [Methanosphaera sp.]|nr:restriction endonuclease subunit S [Methanosphaera sp.]